MNNIFEEINDRKSTLAERVPQVMRQIEQAFAPAQPTFTAKLQRIMADSGSRRNKVIKIQALAAEVRAFSDPYTACRKGCNACCTQRVMMSQTEANAIAYKIGRQAVQLRPGYKMQDIHAYGEDKPCTFLVDGACSIYEHRPVVCRNQVNLDIDPLLCGFENWELHKAEDPRFTPIPMLGLGPIMTAYQQLASQDQAGDIRDFFPPTP
jgi:uncharacterized protein